MYLNEDHFGINRPGSPTSLLSMLSSFSLASPLQMRSYGLISFGLRDILRDWWPCMNLSMRDSLVLSEWVVLKNSTSFGKLLWKIPSGILSLKIIWFEKYWLGCHILIWHSHIVLGKSFRRGQGYCQFHTLLMLQYIMVRTSIHIVVRFLVVCNVQFRVVLCGFCFPIGFFFPSFKKLFPYGKQERSPMWFSLCFF